MQPQAVAETTSPSQPGRGTRHRLTALASGVEDMVAAVGGLLCDRSMAGWDVVVYLNDASDHRSLRVLGVRATDLRTARLRDADEDWPDVVLVCAGLYSSREWVRRHVCAAAGNPGTEVVIWGAEDNRGGLPANLRRTEHRLSSAARAFKKIAVNITTDSVDSVSDAEHLLRVSAVHAQEHST
jgi:hypothetical protein